MEKLFDRLIDDKLMQRKVMYGPTSATALYNLPTIPEDKEKY